MIVYNYPDRCPSCQSEEIIPAMIDPGSDVKIPEGKQPFLCKSCDVMWSETLITSKDWSCQVAILGAAWMLPKGVLVDHRVEKPMEQARVLLGIPEDADHVVMPIQKVLDDGQEQVELVKKGVKKLWTPPSAGGKIHL